MPEFAHRLAAGEVLADQVAARGYPDPVLVAIPKGGVPVAVPLARRLGSPLELCLVAKVPLPWRQEAGIGALAADGTLLLNRELIHVLALNDSMVENAVLEARTAMVQRRSAFQALASLPRLEGKTVVVIDDGLATGYTALTAVEVLRPLGPDRLVVAAPVGSFYALEALAEAGVETVVLSSGDGPFFDVATFYGDFEELEDSQVLRLLESTPQRAKAAS
jgi:predicted phosphoribosyltransferase